MGNGLSATMSRMLAWGVLSLAFAVPMAWATGTDEAMDATAQSRADPAVWGVYARLLDQRWSAVDGGTILFQWSRPGQEMVETMVGSSLAPKRIERGSKPGELYYADSSTGLKFRYVGAVQPDGSVLFEHQGIMKTAFRVLINADGLMEHQWVKVKDGQVTVRDRYTRQYRNVGAESPARVAATPVEGASPDSATTLTAGPLVHTSAAVVAASPDTLQATFGDLVRYAGQRLVGRTMQLEIQWLGDDALAIQFYGASGNPWRRYVVRRSPNKPGALVLAESPFGNARMHAQRNADGSLFVDSQEDWFHGWRYTYLFQATPDGLMATFNNEFKNGLRLTLSSMGGTTNEKTLYKPYTEEAAVEAAVAARMKAHNDRIAAENQRREQQLHDARVAAAFSGLVQGMSQGMDSHAQAREAQQAFLDETAVRAQVIAEMRQEQRLEQAGAGRDAATAPQPASETGRPVADGRAASGESAVKNDTPAASAGAAIVVAGQPGAPSAVARPASNTWTPHALCMYIGPTRKHEDETTATIYFSRVTRFEVEGPFPQGAVENNFVADLRARYGDAGLGSPVCHVGTEAEMAEARRHQDTVRPRYQKESTGIALRL